MRPHFGIKRAKFCETTGGGLRKKHESHRPHPRVSAIALIAERSGTWPRLEGKDESTIARWFETREDALLTMRSFVS